MLSGERTASEGLGKEFEWRSGGVEDKKKRDADVDGVGKVAGRV